MRKILQIVAFVTFTITGFSQTVFFNEINYLPASDTWFEIAGPTGTDLNGWKVVLYDPNGEAYDTISLTQIIPDGVGCNGIVIVDGSVLLSAPGSGMALIDTAPQVVKYLTYGGETTATDGPAIGLTSDNIGTQLINNLSLQLTGIGLFYTNFIWGLPGLASKGLVNLNQTFLECFSFLPIQLECFSGKIWGDKIELKWQTTSEINHSHFEIMYSVDGTQFKKIGRVDSPIFETTTNKIYQFNFQEPELGNNYFRLHQVDNDGKVTTSKIIHFQFDKALQLSVYPNPAKDKIYINIEERIFTSEVRVTLFDVLGKIVHRQQIIADFPLTIDISSLKKGIYALQLQWKSSQVQTIFVKQ